MDLPIDEPTDTPAKTSKMMRRRPTSSRLATQEDVDRWQAKDGQPRTIDDIPKAFRKPAKPPAKPKAQPERRPCAREGCGRPVAYDGAVYCGAACTAMVESKL